MRPRYKSQLVTFHIELDDGKECSIKKVMYYSPNWPHIMGPSLAQAIAAFHYNLVEEGFRLCENGMLETFPPHRIERIWTEDKCLQPSGEWQDENHTYTTGERVLDTRLDCSTERREAA